MSAPIKSKGLNGNSDVELSYDFTHRTPNEGHNYYRVRQFDIDGKESLTKVVDVYFGNDTRVTVYPNPAQQQVNVAIQVQKNTQADIQIIDATGRVVKSTHTALSNGDNTITFDIQNLANGVYQLKVSNDKGLYYSEKITKN